MKLLEVSLPCLQFSHMFSEGEVKSPCFFANVVSSELCVFICPETTMSLVTHEFEIHKTKIIQVAILYTVNQLIFVAIMFRVFLLQDSFAEI